jgi:hypothetical protein
MIDKKIMENIRNQLSDVDNYKKMGKYFLFLFILDRLGIMNLYGSNYARRIIHMYRRTDELAYKNKLKPFCRSIQKMLGDEDVKRLQTIKIPDTRDVSWFSRRNTTSYQCCESYSEEEKKIIFDVTKKIQEKYEKQIGKKLYQMNSGLSTIYVYHGNKSHHLWHVDPRNIDTIYNSITCFKREGNISPLQCKDLKGDINTINFQPGDGAIFNGGTTVHQVPPNDDPNSKRYVLSIAFTTDKELANDDNMTRNMCTFIEGGNNIGNILKLIAATFIINYGAMYLSDVKEIPLPFMMVSTILMLVIVKYFPLYCDIGLGSGRSSSIIKNIVLILLFAVISLSPYGGALFFGYFALSDVFFPRSWAEYH